MSVSRLISASLLLTTCLVFPAPAYGRPKGAAAEDSTVMGAVDSSWQPGVSTLNTDPVTVQAGNTIELTCTSTQRGAVAWHFPSQYAPVEESDEYGTVEIVETENVENSLYHSTIRVYNASYRDTGRYRCYCPGIVNYEHALKHSGNRIVGKISLYVYVADDEHLFLTQPYRMTAVMATVGNPHAFPCAVTDPDVELRLYRLKGYNMEIQLHANDGGRITSNDQTGITLSSVSMMDTGVYICRAIKGVIEQEKRFLVYAVPGAPKVLDPTLTVDHITSATGALVEGGNFSLKCQAPVGRHQTTTVTWWKTDGHSNLQQIEADGDLVHIDGLSVEELCSGGRDMCSFKRKYVNMGLSSTSSSSSSYQKVTSKLRVVDSNTSFSGTYYCKVHTAAGRVVTSNPVGLHINSAANRVVSSQPTTNDVILYEPSANQNEPVIVLRVD